jgi:hypothetical protein
MALLGHTIVEAGWTRLQALWPPTSRPAQLRLRIGLPKKTDHQALKTASAIYAGHITLTADDFAALTWLPHFANSGRQLLMCHALKLLEGWNTQPKLRRKINEEADIVLRLARSAGQFSSALDPSVVSPLSIALQNSVKILMALRVSDPCDQLTKAMTLLEVSRTIEDGFGLAKEAARILDLALPGLIAVDGGPIRHTLPDYAAWINLLFDDKEAPLQTLARNALDRARPFLAMLLDQDQSYWFAPGQKPHSSIVSTAAMRLAPITGVARLQAGKCVAISLPPAVEAEAQLHISSHGQWLLTANHFRHDPEEATNQSCLTLHSSEEGQLLQQTLSSFVRTVFLSPKGDDLRIEDILPSDGLQRWLQLQVNPDAKISITRNGSVATIALDGRNSWQLNLRGARILPMQQRGTMLIETMATERVNWALKRVVRTIHRSEKSTPPELPF